MQVAKSKRERIDDARQLEKDGELSSAAVVYQKLFDEDQGDQAIAGRLLVLYRKLKEYRKELEVLNSALSAYEQRGREAEAKWLKANPKAARASRSVLRQLERGGEKMTAFGVNPMVNVWIKRREFVRNRISGKKGVRKKKADREKEAALAKKEAALAKKEELLDKKRGEAERKKEAVLAKREVAARAKKEAAEAKKRASMVTQMHPSLFVITLSYRVGLEKIDAMMSQHMAYLRKHYEQGDFLVSGRQVPRTGGIILAKGKNLSAVERIVKEDPFVKRRLASVEIVEFSASQTGKGINLHYGK